MLIFSERKYKDQKYFYIHAIIFSNIIFSIAFSIVIFGASIAIDFFSPDNKLSDTLYYYSLVLPLILLLLLARKICLSYRLINHSAVIGYLYIIGSTISLYVLKESNNLSIRNTIMAIGAWSLVSSLLSIWIIRTKESQKSAKRISQREILLSHKDYIKWSLPTAFFSWIPGNTYYIFLTAIGKSELSGLLKAIINMTTPITQVNISLGNVFIKELAENNNNTNQRKNFTKRINLILAVNICLSMFLLYFGASVFNALYKKNLYNANLTLWLLCSFAIVHALLSVTIAFFRAQENPKAVFFSFLISGLFSLSIGIYISYKFEVAGALFSVLIAYLTGYIYLVRELKLRKNEKAY